MTYIERRNVVIAVAAFAAVFTAAALGSDLIWGGTPSSLSVGLAESIPFYVCLAAFWPLAWHYYLKHHYKAEYRASNGPDGEEPH